MIIGLIGYKGSGKSFVAKRLVDRHGFTCLPMAKLLKDMLRALGLNENQISGSEKETPCDLLGGKTPRWAMQSLGTEWGRRMIHDEIWVRAWQHNRPPGDVVCDDIRFPNELTRLTPMGAHFIRIKRPGHDPTYRQHFYQVWLPKAHASESYVSSLPTNYTIINNSTMEAVERGIDHIVGELK